MRPPRATMGLALRAMLTALFLAEPAAAQQFSIDLGDGGTLTGRVIQLLLLITVLSLAPSILVVMTSFTRIVVVLSLLRSALGTQQTPPNTVIVSLALFLTAFVMAPTFQASYAAGIGPLVNEEMETDEAMAASIEPFRNFMLAHVTEDDLTTFMTMGDVEQAENPEAIPLQVLIPAFVVGELRRAFEIGFLLYVPFIVIDLVIASVLMSMGMMMLPPILISLPFKLIFFVLVDGWTLVAGSLVQSFG